MIVLFFDFVVVATVVVVVATVVVATVAVVVLMDPGRTKMVKPSGENGS